MDRLGTRERRRTRREPRARGDGPPQFRQRCCSEQRAPRTRGWTGLANWEKGCGLESPAHAGMDRRRLGSREHRLHQCVRSPARRRSRDKEGHARDEPDGHKALGRSRAGLTVKLHLPAYQGCRPLVVSTSPGLLPAGLPGTQHRRAVQQLAQVKPGGLDPLRRAGCDLRRDRADRLDPALAQRSPPVQKTSPGRPAHHRTSH